MCIRDSDFPENVWVDFVEHFQDFAVVYVVFLVETKRSKTYDFIFSLPFFDDRL